LHEIIRKFRGILSMHVTWPYILSLITIFIILSIIFNPKIEDFFVFFPQTSFDITPDDLRLNYKEVCFYSQDKEKLHGWFFPLNKEVPVILFCHGNAGNISHRLHNIRILLERGIQVFIFDYRGYEKSLNGDVVRSLS
jgi:hypothetical protein